MPHLFTRFSFRSILIAACLWAAAAQAAPATAAVFFDTSPLTLQVCTAPAPVDMAGAVLFGDGTPGSITQAALQTLIDAGGKIIFNGGAAPVTLTLTATLQVDARKEVVIDGLGLLTISGNNAVRIFEKGAATLNEGTLFAVQNMRLVNGRTSDALGGAAIYGSFYGSLKVHNVAFENNQGPLSSGDACGAVWTGGYREASFANCTFLNNRAANGGAIGTIGSSMSIINCLFDGNQAVGTGGTFAQGGQGGAVYTDGVDLNGTNSYLTICGSVFRNSTAGHQAGALNASFYRNRGSVGTIDRCTFENNTCASVQGGAVYLQLSAGLEPTGANGSFTVTNSLFDNNRSPSQGGAAWVGPNTITEFTNCTFANNRADNGSGGGLGGGLAFTEFTVNTVTNCTFSGNKAGDFAASIFNGGITTLLNTLFYQDLIGQGRQANPYAGGSINKTSALTSAGGNLQFPATLSAPFGPETDFWIREAPPGTVLTADAQLQPLADNGGPTRTLALPAGSPAIDAGVPLGAPPADQRGGVRTGNPDIGAFEFGSAVVASPVLAANPGTLSGFTAEPGNPSAPQQYVLAGSNLGSGRVSVRSAPPFQISADGRPFAAALNLDPDPDGTLNKTIQVRLQGGASGSRTGTITHEWDGATLASVNVSGLVVPLPVRLVRFTATPAGSDVLMAWETSSEQNASHFTVQRSDDGREFRPIGRVAAAGDSRSRRTYGFRDDNPLPGTAYYRLHMVDRDEKSEYSRMVAVTLDDATPAMTLLGNPVFDGVVRLAVRHMQGAAYTLHSLAGQAVGVLRVEAMGQHRVDLHLGRVPAGLYLLTARTGSRRQSLKVVVSER